MAKYLEDFIKSMVSTKAVPNQSGLPLQSTAPSRLSTTTNIGRYDAGIPFQTDLVTPNVTVNERVKPPAPVPAPAPQPVPVVEQPKPNLRKILPAPVQTKKAPAVVAPAPMQEEPAQQNPQEPNNRNIGYLLGALIGRGITGIGKGEGSLTPGMAAANANIGGAANAVQTQNAGDEQKAFTDYEKNKELQNQMDQTLVQKAMHENVARIGANAREHAAANRSPWEEKLYETARINDMQAFRDAMRDPVKKSQIMNTAFQNLKAQTPGLSDKERQQKLATMDESSLQALSQGQSPEVARVRETVRGTGERSQGTQAPAQQALADIPPPPHAPAPGMKWKYNAKLKQYKEFPI